VAAGLADVVPVLVLALTGRLREGGVPVSTSEVLDAVRSLRHIDLTDRSRVRAVLRATLVKDVTYDVLFRRSFEAVFPRIRREVGAGDARSSGPAAGSDEGVEDELMESVVRALRGDEEEGLEDALDEAIEQFAAGRHDGRSAAHHAQRMLRRMNVPDLYRRYLDQERAEGAAMNSAASAAEARVAMDQLGRRLEDMLSGRLREGDGVSHQQLEDVQDRPLLRAGADELVAMRVAMRPLARRLAAKLGAGRRRGGTGLDMRRTIRASMGYGGVPAKPILRRRRPTKPDLVVLCDVSGSTAQFAPFTLTLLHAVHEEFRRVRSFVFIDGIVEITEILEANLGVLDPHHLLAKRGLVAHDGRSDYARALTTFLSTWGDIVTARTTVIIAGDARAHEREPATAVVAELGHRSRRLYWLNPEPRDEWDRLDSRASEYAVHCTGAFEVSTIRQLTAAVTQIV
jgi:hypothetical protein